MLHYATPFVLFVFFDVNKSSGTSVAHPVVQQGTEDDEYDEEKNCFHFTFQRLMVRQSSEIDRISRCHLPPRGGREGS